MLDAVAEVKCMKNKKIYYGEIPDIFGDGISALGNSRKEVIETLRKCYDRLKMDCPDEEGSFNRSFEYYGGWVDNIEIGKGYNQGLRS